MHYGKKPFVPDSRDIHYTSVRPKGVLPAIPTGYGRGADFISDAPPPRGWGMMANGPVDDSSLPATWSYAENGCGDCTLADPAHVISMDAHDSGHPRPPISSKTVIDQYTQLTAADNNGQGFNPITGENDNGLYIRSVLDYRQKVGFADDTGARHKIGVYVSIPVGDWQSLREACWIFPGISIGMTVTQAQEDQFSAGQPWTYVAGSPVLGGHDVPLVGHPAAGLWTAVTWARRQVCSYELLVKQCDEWWAYTGDLDRISAVTGKTYNHYTEVDMEEWITLVGKQVQ